MKYTLLSLLWRLEHQPIQGCAGKNGHTIQITQALILKLFAIYLLYSRHDRDNGLFVCLFFKKKIGLFSQSVSFV